MGYRGRSDWRDMSDYVVHLTKGDAAYEQQLGILGSGTIQAQRAFGCATGVQGLGSSQQTACFSEVPLDMLDRLVTRTSS